MAQLIDDLAKGPMAGIFHEGQERWVISRPFTCMFFGDRLKDAWGVFKGKYEAVKFIGQDRPPKAY